jgi:hypothetical protein
MEDLQVKSGKIKQDILDFLALYENLVREVNTLYINEQVDAGGTEELAEFYRLLQTIKRNRDVIGSVARGFNNIRPTTGFRFVEEELENKKESRKREKEEKQKVEKKKKKAVADKAATPQDTEPLVSIKAQEPEEVFSGFNP